MRAVIKKGAAHPSRNMRFLTGLIVLLIFGTGVVQAAAINVSAEWDETADFDSLKTYQWLPEPPERLADRKINYLLLSPRVTGSVNIDLKAKGYQEITSGTPDFFVGYHVARKSKIWASTINGFYGYSPNLHVVSKVMGGRGYEGAYVEQYDEGTLIIDIVDAKKGVLIWRGYGSAGVDTKDSLENKTEIIQDATGKILEQFPSQLG